MRGYTVGIGVSTYNRSHALRKCLTGILRNTCEDQLGFNVKICVSDDGSSDDTSAVAYSFPFDVLLNTNGGVARNKNRLLHYLFIQEDCDAVILLEDDVIPCRPDWLSYIMSEVFNSGAVFEVGEGINIEGGKGEVGDPWLTKDCVAQIIGVSREAFNFVGYMEPRFKKFGFEHAEWQRRLTKKGYGGLYDKGDYTFYALKYHGVKIDDCESTGNEKLIDENNQVFLKVGNDCGYKDPWVDEKDKLKFMEEVKAGNYP